jgi:NADH-quinone oxidoreductase subunit L
MNLGPNRFFHFLEPSLSLALAAEGHEFSHLAELGFAALSLAVAGLGIAVAYRFYVVHPGEAGALASRFGAVYRLLFRKYYVDELYDATMVHPTVRGSTELLWKRMDIGWVDGAVNGVATTVQGLAGVLKNLQNGLIRSYATWILLGTAAALVYISVFRG